MGELFISAALPDEKETRAIALFAFNAEEEPRRSRYLKLYPGNYEMVRYEQRLDFEDWYIRRRGDRERFEGIDESVVSQWRRHQ